MSHKCLRCGRPLKDPTKDYCRVCGAKVAANTRLDGRVPTVVRNKKGEVMAVIV